MVYHYSLGMSTCVPTIVTCAPIVTGASFSTSVNTVLAVHGYFKPLHITVEMPYSEGLHHYGDVAGTSQFLSTDTM